MVVEPVASTQGALVERVGMRLAVVTAQGLAQQGRSLTDDAA
jgi:hypothetical protein